MRVNTEIRSTCLLMRWLLFSFKFIYIFEFRIVLSGERIVLYENVVPIYGKDLSVKMKFFERLRISRGRKSHFIQFDFTLECMNNDQVVSCWLTNLGITHSFFYEIIWAVKILFEIN